MPRSTRRKKECDGLLQRAAENNKKIHNFFSRSGPSPSMTIPESPESSASEAVSGCEATITASEPVGVELQLAQGSSLSDVTAVNLNDTNIQTASENTIPQSESKRTYSRKQVKISTVKAWNFDWLEFAEDAGLVTQVWCRPCREVFGSDDLNLSSSTGLNEGQRQLCDTDAYIRGTANVKKDTAKSHSMGVMHRKAESAVKQNERSKSELVSAMCKMNDVTRQRMTKLFDWAYAIAKKELPFKLFPTLVNVEKKHGIDIGEKYINPVQCQNFVMVIGRTMVDEMREIFHQKPFYCSILFDGSTDKTLKEKEVINVKVFDWDSGTATFKLLGISEPESGTAGHIYESVLKLCEEMGLNLKTSCVAAAADGASVNFGSSSGVLTRIRENCTPWLLSIHCVAHRLELAIQTGFKGTYFTDVIDDLLCTLYYMFKRSAKKWNELNRVAEALEEHIVKPVRAQGTRWIDHRKEALKALTKNYKSLVTQLEEWASGERDDVSSADSAKMKGYLRKMKSLEFVSYVAAYIDMTEDLSELSKYLQSEDLPVNSVRSSVETAVMSLKMKLDRRTNSFICMPNVAEIMDTVCLSNGDSACEWKGVKLERKSWSVEKFSESIDSVLKNTIQCIETRFHTFEDEVFLAFEVFDPSNFPASKADLATFGVNEVDVLLNQFREVLVSQSCDIRSVQKEWLKLKLDIYTHYRNKQMTVSEMWAKICCEKRVMYQNVLHLVQIYLVIPVSTASIERQFSCVKRILGDWRLRLALNTVETLLRIFVEGPSVEEFNADKSPSKWIEESVRGRRADTV